jgi:hypothetical protein
MEKEDRTERKIQKPRVSMAQRLIIVCDDPFDERLVCWATGGQGEQ